MMWMKSTLTHCANMLTYVRKGEPQKNRAADDNNAFTR